MFTIKLLMVNKKDYGPLTILNGEDMLLSVRLPADYPITKGSDVKLVLSYLDLIVDNKTIPKEVDRIIKSLDKYNKKRRIE